MASKAYLLLADGLQVEGTAIGYKGTVGGEVCFNTGMTGYQEIYTDPSYYGQIVLNTTPHIGNYGTYDAERESAVPQIKGLAVDGFSKGYSRPQATASLQDYLQRHRIVGIADIDIRKLVRHIRSRGAMNALISSTLSPKALASELRKVPSMEGLELASKVSAKKTYFVGDPAARFKVAVLDLGVKKSILSQLAAYKSYCKVFPARTSFAEMETWKPDGYLISNGPGDPSSTDYAIKTVKEILRADKPLFGICLGHQLLALACDIPTYKMRYGHRGLNHPVKHLATGRGEITSQNHGFAVSEERVARHATVEATHVHLNDNTVMGLQVKEKKAFSVQYHPEASPGSHDAYYLFKQFTDMMEGVPNTRPRRLPVSS